MQLLVVDEDEALCRLFILYAKDQLGFKVLGVTRLADACDLLKIKCFDLLVLGIPDQTELGFQALASIRQLYSRESLPILLMTSAERSEDIFKGYELGADDFITKPVNPALAMVRIQNLLKNRQPVKPQAPAAVKPAPSAPAPQPARPAPALRPDSTPAPTSSQLGGAIPAVNAAGKPVDLGLYREPEAFEISQSNLLSGLIDGDTFDALHDVLEALNDLEVPHTAQLSQEDILAKLAVTDREALVPPSSAPKKPSSDAEKGADTQIHNLYATSIEDDPPIPCEMPVLLLCGQRQLFCKTLLMSTRHLLLLSFEEVPKAANYKLQLSDPKGENIELDVVERDRSSQKEGTGVVKISLKIQGSYPSFDEFYSNLSRAYFAKGVQGLNAVLRGQALEDTPAAKPNNSPSGAASLPAPRIAQPNSSGVRYRFERKLGKGGFAAVYLVRDLALKRSVAMKVLNSKMANQPDARDNFLAEAQIAAQFHHPRIVFVFEVGQILPDQYRHFLEFPQAILQEYPERLIYFTMQFVEGQTLAEVAAEPKPLEMNRCLDIFIAIADALDYAHQKGVIHRDIKPGNIMLDKKGEVVVTDFGIAKLLDTNQLGDTIRMSGQNQVSCTPLYAAPEVFTGKPLDARSDIYSLGVLMYLLIGGEPPFRGKDLMDLVYKHVNVAPAPLAKLRSDVDSGIATIVSKCLAKSPTERFLNSGLLLETLRKLKGQGERKQNSDFDAGIETLLNQAILAASKTESAVVLRQLTALLRVAATSDRLEAVREVLAKITDPTMISLLIERNLNDENQEQLYLFFKQLDSSRAVFSLLQWFQRTKDPAKKEMLARMAVLSSGRNLLPLVLFGLELADADAAILLRGFHEINPSCSEPVFLKWQDHTGQKTQIELLNLMESLDRPAQEILSIVAAFESGKKTVHKIVQSRAREVMSKRTKKT